jgi:periplasmic protein TonB
MPRRPSPSAALRSQYGLIFQLSLIGSLVLLIGLFAAPIRSGPGTIDIVLTEHEVVKVEDVEQTQQLERPPPPPSMPPPIEVPDEQIIEDVIIDLDIDLDLTRAVPPPPPPPPAASAAPAPEPEPDMEEIFVVVEQMPELIGGLEAVQALIRYPEMARRAGIEGTVHVQFIVDENGRVVDPIVARGIGGGCDEVALEAVRQVSFRPGVQRGRNVKVRYAIPVRFRLREATN